MVFRSPQSKAQGPQEAPESDQLTTSGISLNIEAVSKTFPGRAAIVEALRPVKVDIIDLPRPRLLENQMVVDRASQITSVLREEIGANTQGGSLRQWQGGVRISNPEFRYADPMYVAQENVKCIFAKLIELGCLGPEYQGDQVANSQGESLSHLR